MLAKANRVVSAADFKATVRRGRRVGTPNALLYILRSNADAPTRFGFIVAKTVGNSVKRNLVARRFRAIGRESLVRHPTGHDVVIRALPGSPQAAWANLRLEILDGLDRSASER